MTGAFRQQREARLQTPPSMHSCASQESFLPARASAQKQRAVGQQFELSLLAVVSILILPPRDHFSGTNATAEDAFADPNPNMRPIGSKSRNEVLGARVVLYMAAKKGDMAAPFPLQSSDCRSPKILIRSSRAVF